jgi:hypothetical protein
VTGIEPACPAWEVQKWQFSDQLKSEKCLIRCYFDYPLLPDGNRCFPCHVARLVARNACAVFLAGHEVPTRLAVPAFSGSCHCPWAIQRGRGIFTR